MPSCAFLKCTNHTGRDNKTNGITFHAFPENELFKHEWVKVVQRQRRDYEWTPTKHSRVCSMHFKPADIYKTSKGLTRISKGAIPYFQAAMKSANYSYHASSRPDSPNSLENESISDAESIFETRRISFLKMKMRKIMIAKQKLLKDNNNLKKKNRRLYERCKSLKEIVVKIKKIISVGKDQFQELCIKAEAEDLFSRLMKRKKSPVIDHTNTTNTTSPTNTP